MRYEECDYIDHVSRDRFVVDAAFDRLLDEDDSDLPSVDEAEQRDAVLAASSACGAAMDRLQAEMHAARLLRAEQDRELAVLNRQLIEAFDRLFEELLVRLF